MRQKEKEGRLQRNVNEANYKDYSYRKIVYCNRIKISYKIKVVFAVSKCNLCG